MWNRTQGRIRQSSERRALSFPLVYKLVRSITEAAEEQGQKSERRILSLYLAGSLTRSIIEAGNQQDE